MTYICSNCSAPAYIDGRDGDEIILLCGCDRRDREWIEDGDGGHWTNPSGAKPIDAPYYSEAEEWDDWIRRKR
jgi:hypothetical protein